MSAPQPRRKALFVRLKEPSSGDRKIVEHLETLNFEVTSVDSAEAVARPDDKDIELIVISSTSKADVLEERFAETPVPVVVLDVDLFRFMGLSEITENSASKITELDITGPGHPLAAGLIGRVSVCSEEMSIYYGHPGEKAIVIASLPGEPEHAAIFAYEVEEEMSDGFRAPARRVAMTFKDDIIDEGTGKMWALFKQAVRWAAGIDDPYGPKKFSEIFKEECGEILDRRYRLSVARRRLLGLNAGHSPALADSTPENLIGLALSGGGIRSATFALGLLQGLKDRGMLPIFDYLSTVSGGGYLGGWWSAWLSRELQAPEDETRELREAREKKLPIFPDPEKIMHAPEDDEEVEQATGYKEREQLATGEEITEGSQFAGRDPIHHLRLFSNYLTPRKGTLSADTWRAVAIATRNLIMTWLILVPMLFAAVVAGQLYFIVQSGSSGMFVHYPTPTPTPAEASAPAPAATPAPAGELSFKATITEESEVKLQATAAPTPKPTPASSIIHHYSAPDVLQQRAVTASVPLLALAGWIIIMISYWMTKNTSGSPHMSDFGARTLGLLGGIVTWTLIGLVIYWSLPEQNLTKNAVEFWAWAKSRPLAYKLGIAAWVLIGGVLIAHARRRHEAEEQSERGGVLRKFGERFVRDFEANRKWRRQVIRNQIIRIHASLLVIFVVLAFVLLIAGFGHEIAEFLFEAGSGYVRKAGGVLAVLLSGLGAIYMAVKASPSGGGSAGESRTTLTTRLIFALTPPLVIVVLTIALAWASHMLLYHFASARQIERLYPLDLAAFTAIFLALVFAIAEIKWWPPTRWWHSIRFWAFIVVGLTAISLGITGIYLWRENYDLVPVRFVRPLMLALLATTGIMLLTRLAFVEVKKDSKDGKETKDKRERRFRFFLKGWYKEKKPRPRTILFMALALTLLTLAAGTVLALTSNTAYGRLVEQQIQPRFLVLTIASCAVLALCLVTVVLELFLALGQNRLSLWLLFSIFVLTSALLLLSAQNPLTAPDAIETNAPQALAHAAIGLMALALGWVIALGWMADPNMLSLHSFYKERLVRAYMGASNRTRNRQQAEITEAVENDDVPLRKLNNCRRGAPYHLINTTLNLVGGRDLTTAQRSSVMFLLSKRFCGSTRTSYRRTAEYMSGQMMLGTGVAISGAAASPNMGTLKTTSAQAMLLTLLNVRLGYWAPTPKKEQWRSSHARLWPFYMLREFLSQTNDLASYCYLTDGGHFDNLGLYSLIERGCRLIVVSDATADPKPCFSDLGDVIRRCRIDFGAEINLVVDNMRRNKDTKEGETFVVGTIDYAQEHMEALYGKETAASRKRRGIIVLIKPAMKAGVNADLRQYSLENDAFPDQTTGDQFFDEAQFESYRKMGEFCVGQAFKNVQLSGDETFDRLMEIMGYSEKLEKD